MRTYDDTFSGQRIYPGKVYLCSISTPPILPNRPLPLRHSQQQQALAHYT